MYYHVEIAYNEVEAISFCESRYFRSDNMTLQQIKSILSYVLLITIAFLIASHFIWPTVDLAIPIFLLILLILVLYIRLDKVKETTLCFIVKDDKVLMMLRNKKKNDVFLNKYNGLGGRVERGESAKQCILREVMEEAGVLLTRYEYVGKVHFKNFGYQMGSELMYCFVAYDYKGKIGECDEGELVWINIDEVLNLPLWEGDKYFVMNIIKNKKFKGTLEYKEDKVVNYNFYVQNPYDFE